MRVIGHRGLLSLAPENTYAAFDATLEAGADGIETDIQTTADGKLILIHDESLERTTNGTGLVSERDWDYIKTLDAGSWFDDKFSDEKVPLLEDFLKKYGHRTMLDLEIKQPGVDEIEVLKLVKKYVPMKNVTFTSFDFLSIYNIKKTEKNANVGFLIKDLSRQYLDLLKETDINLICPAVELVTPGLIKKCHSMGISIMAYAPGKGLPDSVVKKVINDGADAVIVNDPMLLLTENSSLVQSGLQQSI